MWMSTVGQQLRDASYNARQELSDFEFAGIHATARSPTGCDACFVADKWFITTDVCCTPIGNETRFDIHYGCGWKGQFAD